MKHRPPLSFALLLIGTIFAASTLIPAPTFAVHLDDGDPLCHGLPDYDELTQSLRDIVAVGDPSVNSGLANHMWATTVNHLGVVCSVTSSSDNQSDQLLAARVISAQKASTANALALPASSAGLLPGMTFSTSHLFAGTQPWGGSFGVQFTNQMNPEVAYRGNPSLYGLRGDPMVGGVIGGIIVFAGGIALHDTQGNRVGGLGASGDTGCADHIIAWKMRDAFGLDNVPFGFSATGDDNIVHDIVTDPVTGLMSSPSGFGYPECDALSTAIIQDLPTCYPMGSVQGPVSGAAPSCPSADDVDDMDDMDDPDM